MLDYQPPQRDFEFLLFDLFKVQERWARIPAFADFGEDLTRAVLNEGVSVSSAAADSAAADSAAADSDTADSAAADSAAADCDAGETDENYLAGKLATARFFFARILPRTAAHKAAIEAGAACLMDVSAEELSSI